MHLAQAHIDTLPEAYEVIKSMNLSGDWGTDLQTAARDAFSEVIEKRMDVAIDRYLERIAAGGGSDRPPAASDHEMTGLAIACHGISSVCLLVAGIVFAAKGYHASASLSIVAGTVLPMWVGDRTTAEW